MPPDVALQTRQSEYPLTDRQRAVLTLVTQYYAVASELPSCGLIARKLSMSRQRAHAHLDLLRTRGWLNRG